ncbi:hypothetical protein Tco_0753359 [Tanacetum coccineum]
MVTLVDGVLASGVVMIFEMDIAFYAIQGTEILSLMIRLRIPSIILPIFHTHLHNPNTCHTLNILILQLEFAYHHLMITHCGNKSILRVLRIILVILPEHPSETIVCHNEDGNPARANIKQALGYLKDGDRDGNSQFLSGQVNNQMPRHDLHFAQDGDPSQDDVRLCLDDDLKKAQDHSQRQANKIYDNLGVSSPSGDRNKIYDLGICIEVESTRFLATFPPVIDTLFPFSSKNGDKVFNHGVLATKEKSPPSSSHRRFKASKLFHHKSPVLIHGEKTPNLGVRYLHFYPP